MKRLLSLFVLALAVLLVPSSDVLSSSYQFYHVAVRDFNGDGVFNNTGTQDIVRYGFTFDGPQDTTGWFAVASSKTQTEQYNFGSSGLVYKESDGTSAWQDYEYWGANFVNTNNINNLKLYDNHGNIVADHNVNLPPNYMNDTFSAYSGIDVHNISWNVVSNGIQFSFEPPGISDRWTYRFTLNGNYGGVNYDFLIPIYGAEEDVFISNDLLDGLGGDWYLEFQQRFEGPDSGYDNFNWIRSQSGGVMIDISQNGTTAVPIPGAALLLGSGLLSFFGLRRRHLN